MKKKYCGQIRLLTININIRYLEFDIVCIFKNDYRNKTLRFVGGKEGEEEEWPASGADEGDEGGPEGGVRCVRCRRVRDDRR